MDDTLFYEILKGEQIIIIGTDILDIPRYYNK